MESGALSDPDFADFANDVVLFCHITSHVSSDPYQTLLGEKGGRGFPTLLFMDHDGNVLAQQRDRSVDGFRETLAGDVKEFLALRDLAATGNPDARRKLFVASVELGHFAKDAEAARRAMKQLELRDPERKKVERTLVEQEFNAVYTSILSIDDAPDAGRKLLPMYRAGRVPSGRNATLYWFFLCKHAEHEKDVELLEACLGALKETAKNDRRAERFIPELEKALEKLRGNGR